MHARRRTTPSRPLPFLLFFPFLLLPSILLIHRSTSHLTSFQTSTSFRRVHHDQTPKSNNNTHNNLHDNCFIIGTDPNFDPVWQYNSRSLCLSHDICLSKSHPPQNVVNNVPTRTRTTHCAVLTTGLQPTNAHVTTRALRQFASCEQIRHTLVSCAHDGDCRQHQSTPARGLDDVKWNEDGIAILIPEYPFMGNIYHFANVITLTAYVVRRIPQLTMVASWPDLSTSAHDHHSVSVVFKGRENFGGWRRGLVDLLLGTVRKEFLSERDENHPACYHNAVLLGFRGHVNVWPYGNDTAVSTNGMQIPADAAWVRDQAYHAASLPGVFQDAEEGKQLQSRMRLPPLRVGYARRVSEEDLADIGDGSGGAGEGSARRFSAEDEVWFMEMVEDEAIAHGMQFDEFVAGNGVSFLEQIRLAESFGVMVGIHGANLVNAMFMRSMGALVEVLPPGMGSQCYVGGMNSGLASWQFEAMEGDGDTCDRRLRECRRQMRERVVPIGGENERRKLRSMVGEAMASVVRMWKVYGERGVPVRFDRARDLYIVDSE